MVNWTDTMARGLAARKQFGGGGVRMGRTTSRGGVQEGGYERLGNKPTQATAIKANSALPREQAEAGIAKTEAETARLKGAQTPLEKAEEKGKRLSNIALGLKNATAFLPHVTKDTYDDYYTWIRESNFVPKGVFPSPEEIAEKSPLEFKAWASRQTLLGGSNIKTLERMDTQKRHEDNLQIKKDAATDKKATKELKATALKEYRRVITAQKTLERLDKIMQTEDLTSRQQVQYDQATNVVGESMGGEEPPELPEGLTPEIMEQYRSSYDGWSDDQIIKAYEAWQADQGGV